MTDIRKRMAILRAIYRAYADLSDGRYSPTNEVPMSDLIRKAHWYICGEYSDVSISDIDGIMQMTIYQIVQGE